MTCKITFYNTISFENGVICCNFVTLNPIATHVKNQETIHVHVAEFFASVCHDFLYMSLHSVDAVLMAFCRRICWQGA